MLDGNSPSLIKSPEKPPIVQHLYRDISIPQFPYTGQRSPYLRSGKHFIQTGPREERNEMIDWLDSDLCWIVDSAEAYDYLMEERKRKGSRNESERRKMRDIKKSKEVWKNKNTRIRMRKVKKKKIQKKRMEKTQIRIKTAKRKNTQNIWREKTI